MSSAELFAAQIRVAAPVRVAGAVVAAGSAHQAEFINRRCAVIAAGAGAQIPLAVHLPQIMQGRQPGAMAAPTLAVHIADLGVVQLPAQARVSTCCPASCHSSWNPEHLLAFAGFCPLAGLAGVASATFWRSSPLRMRHSSAPVSRCASPMRADGGRWPIFALVAQRCRLAGFATRRWDLAARCAARLLSPRLAHQLDAGFAIVGVAELPLGQQAGAGAGVVLLAVFVADAGDVGAAALVGAGVMSKGADNQLAILAQPPSKARAEAGVAILAMAVAASCCRVSPWALYRLRAVSRLPWLGRSVSEPDSK